jgi:VWFA-related protein
MLSLLAALPLFAQGAPAPPAPPASPQVFSEQIEVNVVNVDVYVADAQGHPITDLKQQDFQVFEDGKPVEVTNFYATASAGRARANTAPGAAPAASEDLRPEEQRLNLVVFVDDVNTGAHSRNRVLGELQNFLKREVTPGDRVMLIRFQSSLDVRRPFTTDVGQVQKDIAVLEKLSAHGTEGETLRQGDNEIMAAAAEAFGSGCDQALESAVKAYADSQNHLLDSTLRALDSVVSAVAAAPGRKAILYVGDGVSANPGFEGFQRLGACAGASGVTSGFISARSYDSRAKFNAVTGHASRNRVAFYTLETTANQAGILSERDRVENRQESLRRLAEGTGGRAMLNTSDARLSLNLMADDLGHYYSLGYRPPRNADAVDHKIEVKVTRKGALARYRQWYRDKPQTEVVADRTGAAMLYGFEDNPLGVRIELGRQVAQGDIYMVPVRLHVPLSKLTLIPQDGNRVGHVHFFVVASGNGLVTPVRSSEADVRIPEARAAAALGQDYVHEVRMKLKRGEYVLGIGLRDDLAGAASYLKGSVQAGAGLPAPAAAPAKPAPPTPRGSTPGKNFP